MMARASLVVSLSVTTLLVVVGVVGCRKGPSPRPNHRERARVQDANCRDAARPRAYLYPAENRTDYGPDDPKKDGCELLVPDHLFCCPDAERPTDR